jgi:hypothetical protein
MFIYIIWELLFLLLFLFLSVPCLNSFAGNSMIAATIYYGNQKCFVNLLPDLLQNRWLWSL